jgi:hypothetical protein
MYSKRRIQMNAGLLLFEQDGGSIRRDGTMTIQKKYQRIVVDGGFLTADEYETNETKNRFGYVLRWLKDDGLITYHGTGHGHGYYELTQAGRVHLRHLHERMEETEATDVDEVTTTCRRLDDSIESIQVVRHLPNGNTLIGIEDEDGGCVCLCESTAGLTDADLTA